MPDAATLKAQADRARALKSTERTFDFCGRILKAWKAKDAAGTEQMYLEAVASSTIIDRMGDSMTLACLEGMKQQAVGLTVFMNHDYDVSTDVFGTIEEARIVPASDSKQGDCYDLITRTVVEADNPRAVPGSLSVTTPSRSCGPFITGRRSLPSTTWSTCVQTSAGLTA